LFVLCSVLTNTVDSWDCEFKDVALCSINMEFALLALLLLWDFYVPPQLLHVVSFWWK